MSKLTGENFLSFIDVRILSSSSSPASAQRRRKDRFIPKRREMAEPSEIFEGREKGIGNHGVDRTKAGDEERFSLGMKNGPGMDHFGFGFEMVLAGLLLPGMDHFGFGFEMVLAGGRGVPSSARRRVVRIVKKGASCGTRTRKNGPGCPFWLRL